MVAWVVPQIMEAWDDESIDANRTISRIINGVLHHPAQRDMGDDGARDGRQILFRSVQQWWEEMDEGQRDDYRRKLSREGVESGHNHREGQHDSGHGCGKPLKMHKEFGSGGTMEDKIAGAAAGAIVGGITGGIASMVKSNTGVHIPSSEDHRPTDFGGAWNMLSSTAGVSSGGHGGGGGHGGDDGLGGIVGKMGSMFSGRGGGGSSRGMGGGETTYESSGYADDGGYNQEYSRTDYSEYGQREGSGGYGYEEHTESTWQSSSGDGYGGDSYAEQQPEESSGGGFGGGFSSMLRQASEAFGGGGGEEEYHEERRDEEESGGGGGWFS